MLAVFSTSFKYAPLLVALVSAALLSVTAADPTAHAGLEKRGTLHCMGFGVGNAGPSPACLGKQKRSPEPDHGDQDASSADAGMQKRNHKPYHGKEDLPPGVQGLLKRDPIVDPPRVPTYGGHEGAAPGVITIQKRSPAPHHGPQSPPAPLPGANEVEKRDHRPHQDPSAAPANSAALAVIRKRDVEWSEEEYNHLPMLKLDLDVNANPTRNTADSRYFDDGLIPTRENVDDEGYEYHKESNIAFNVHLNRPHEQDIWSSAIVRDHVPFEKHAPPALSMSHNAHPYELSPLYGGGPHDWATLPFEHPSRQHHILDPSRMHLHEPFETEFERRSPMPSGSVFDPDGSAGHLHAVQGPFRPRGPMSNGDPHEPCSKHRNTHVVHGRPGKHDVLEPWKYECLDGIGFRALASMSRGGRDTDGDAA